jgi:hypothetical protein
MRAKGVSSRTVRRWIVRGGLSAAQRGSEGPSPWVVGHERPPDIAQAIADVQHPDEPTYTLLEPEDMFDHLKRSLKLDQDDWLSAILPYIPLSGTMDGPGYYERTLTPEQERQRRACDGRQITNSLPL